MGAVKIVVNHAAVGELLRSQEILDELERHARPIAEAAGAGFEVGTFVGRTRARATVITATAEAMIAEATDGRLTAAIDAGRT